MDTIRENRRNIYEWNEMNQSILEIDFDSTYWNESESSTIWRFGISKYHHITIRTTFQCHWTRITKTISLDIDRNKIWKVYIHSFPIIPFLLRIVNEHVFSFLPQSEYQPSEMYCNDGRSIHIISHEFIQYSRLLLMRIYLKHNHLV